MTSENKTADWKRVAESAVRDSHAGTRNFGQIIRELAENGVESYRVDYREHVSTYFHPSGESHAIHIETAPGSIGDTFDADALVGAIRGSQQGIVKYPEFVRRSMGAGCIGYVVWIAGRHVTYFGRRGETHVERFPS